MKPLVQTLCYIYDGEKILLGMKKRGFGEGSWNAFGGKVEDGESVEESAIRELKEESGLKVKGIELRGRVYITNTSFKDIDLHIFKINDYEGELEESEEMRPGWFSYEDIPYEKMWPNDRYHVPMLLEDVLFEGRFHLEDGKRVVHHEIRKVESFHDRSA